MYSASVPWDRVVVGGGDVDIDGGGVGAIHIHSAHQIQWYSSMTAVLTRLVCQSSPTHKTTRQTEQNEHKTLLWQFYFNKFYRVIKTGWSKNKSGKNAKLFHALQTVCLAVCYMLLMCRNRKSGEATFSLLLENEINGSIICADDCDYDSNFMHHNGATANNWVIDSNNFQIRSGFGWFFPPQSK